MLKTILLLILSHGICNLPIRFALVFDFLIPDSIPNLSYWYVYMMIYTSQYAINFFIYAGSNDQYKKAYLEFWKYLSCHDSKKQDINNKDELRRMSSTITRAFRFLQQISTKSDVHELNS